MKVKIKSATMVAYWSWDVGDNDICGICQSPFDATCPNCEMPGEECPLIHGACGHTFHLHCLHQWLASSTNGEQCPLDRSPWKTAEAARR